MDILQQLVNGLILGSIYSIVALGYAVVYGVLRLFNFAHGDLFMLGAYLGTGAALAAAALLPGAVGLVAGLAVLAVTAAAMAGTGAAGLLVERLAYRPVARSTRLAQLISVLGSSIVIQNAVMLVAGKRNVFFPELVAVRLFAIGSVTVTSVQLLIVAAACVLMAGLYLLFNRTRFGLRIRAVAENRTAAELVGISTRGVLERVFFIGPALGGAAGVLYGLYYGTAGYSMGYIVGIKAFVATVLGGIGSISGAMLGGLLLGILENVGAGLLPVVTGGVVGPEYKDAFSFLILIVMLLVRPQGLLGERG
jgi:branched-chain amino acid transport system permease protein